MCWTNSNGIATAASSIDCAAFAFAASLSSALPTLLYSTARTLYCTTTRIPDGVEGSTAAAAAPFYFTHNYHHHHHHHHHDFSNNNQVSCCCYSSTSCQQLHHHRHHQQQQLQLPHQTTLTSNMRERGRGFSCSVHFYFSLSAVSRPDTVAHHWNSSTRTRL